MTQTMSMPDTFWIEVERNVSSKVGEALNTGDIPHAVLISYLRDLEIMARTGCDRRETIQIIASGRSVLGDRTRIGPSDGPFSSGVA